MEGKVAVVTGANSGVGLETAVALASAGAETTMVCRDRTRGQAALEEVKRRSGSQLVHLDLADLSSRASLASFADAFRSSHDRLDVLVNNAGAVFAERQVSADGLEMTFALNHMGYFRLTLALLDLLRASPAGRVVNVASEAHRSAVLDFDDLQAERNFKSFEVYGRSKLMNIMFTYELARRLEGGSVTANCLHPGVVNTNFASHGSWILRLAFAVARPFLLSPASGAATQIHLAMSPEVKDVSGKYFVKKRAVRSSQLSYDVEAGRRLWRMSEEVA
jgi:NAD(P)-dependent dehydrogenase (short-subunit alcohol dehydrogenase family)